MDDQKDEIVSRIDNKNNTNDITPTNVNENNLTNHIDVIVKTKSFDLNGTNHIKDNNLESDATSSREEGGVSCLGRVTWLHGGETEIDDEDDDDESEDGESVDSSSSSSTETIVRQQSRWGWFVVFGSMIIHMIADGITFSFGVLLHSLIDEFNKGNHTMTQDYGNFTSITNNNTMNEEHVLVTKGDVTFSFFIFYLFYFI